MLEDHLWTAATRHPFLDGVRDGSLPVHALDTWLAQDALFVADLLVFQARLLARAPRSDQAVLAGGTVALVEELDWFERLAADLVIDHIVEPEDLRSELLHRLRYAANRDRSFATKRRGIPPV